MYVRCPFTLKQNLKSCYPKPDQTTVAEDSALSLNLPELPQPETLNIIILSLIFILGKYISIYLYIYLSMYLSI